MTCALSRTGQGCGQIGAVAVSLDHAFKSVILADELRKKFLFSARGFTYSLGLRRQLAWMAAYIKTRGQTRSDQWSGRFGLVVRVHH